MLKLQLVKPINYSLENYAFHIINNHHHLRRNFVRLTLYDFTSVQFISNQSEINAYSKTFNFLA